MRKRRAADLGCVVPHLHEAQGERTIMNVLTDLLAGFLHFVGWLV
ncbi:hypothetical protein [Streptomyces sp. NRRL S-118]|nr:hypothetical protein [Streptomyces sp. NRRL S-118]